MENNTLIWTEEMSVGVKEIDDQHKFFVNLISNLYNAIYESKVKEELEGIINSLVSYADLHFTTEENYFDKFNYEFSLDHKKRHKDLKDKVMAFYKEFKDGDNNMAIRLADFLTDWLVEHLEVADKKYTKCFHEHGLF